MKMKKILIAAGITVLTAAAGVGGWLSAKGSLSGENEFTADWYTEDTDEFVITTPEQLYEMSKLSRNHDFAGQTFLLGNDIVMNQGTPDEWGFAMPEYLWEDPIYQFAGTFDGQGHTISGVYAMGYDLGSLDLHYENHPAVEYWSGKSLYLPTGLFAYTKDTCVIKNLKVTDSIFYNWSNNGGGSIISNGAGTLSNVYSNATVVGYWEKNGGLVGVAENGAIHMDNCWFDGQLLMKGPRGSYGGGLIGVVKKASETTSVTHCLCTAVITNEFTNDEPRIGGFAGVVFDGGHLLLEDSLSLSSITALRHDSIGSAVGRLEGNATLAASSAYSDLSGYPAALGYWGGQIQSYPIGLSGECFEGEAALAWTELDFEKTWTIVPGGTPILRAFADQTDDRTSAAKAYDTSWYDKGKTDYTLTSLDQLYGFYILSASNNFSGRTVKLGGDIIVNTGDAKDWSPENMPENPWYPINRFAGTFDGQGHTVSGVYLYSNQPGTGLFTSVTNTGLIRNIRLENASFLNTSQLFSYMGSIVGCCEGTVDTVYSNAIMESSATRSTGGIIGSCRGTETVTISNCWFDGSITLTEGSQGSQAGGIAGNHEGPVRIRHCLNSGSISGGVLTGGIIGIMGGTVFEITDCLNVGEIPAQKHAGSISGWLGARSTLTFENTYASAESCIKALDNVQSEYVGGCMTIPVDYLTGENAYIWTMLDFDEYWAIREGDTPVLRSFAQTVPSTAGLKKIMDTSWYSVREKEYVLDSVEDLYGFAYMSYNTDFARKSVKLACDIKVNSGDVSGWEKSAPANLWFPIYSFAGDFNGQGHTVSGLYQKLKTEDPSGMFARVNGSISRLRLTNSYFEKDGPYCGSVAGIFSGSMDRVYSNAIIKASCSERSRFGGIVSAAAGEASFTECWFDGTVDAEENRYVGGIVGAMENGTKKVSISHCLSSGDLSARDHVANICGYIVEGDLTIDDCLGIGGITTIGSTVGTLVGGRYSAVPEIRIRNSAGVGKSTIAGTAAPKEVTNSAWVNSRTSQQLCGVDGFFLASWLKFEEHWVIRDRNTPALRSLSGKGQLQKALENFKNSAKTDKNGKAVYTISDADDLTGFALYTKLNNLKGATVKLTSNITVNSGKASDWKNNPPENSCIPIGSAASPFAGTFDGQGHSIRGLYQKVKSDDPTGLFAQTAESSVIKDLRIENSYFEKDGPYCGSVAGIFSGTMERVYSNATVRAAGNERSRFGGLVSAVTGNVTMNECWFDGTVNASNNRYVGGLIGSMENNTRQVSVKHSMFSGSLSALDHCGGICGYIVEGNITADDCLSIGSMRTDGKTIGTIVGGRFSAAPQITIRNSAGVGNPDLAGTAAAKEITGSAKINSRTRDQLTGAEGLFLNAWIDFNDHYMVRDTDVPALRSLEKKISKLQQSMEDFQDSAVRDENGRLVYSIGSADEMNAFILLSRQMDFSGAVVTLTADVDMNPGWSAGAEAPSNVWSPIGSTSRPFAGIFDGQGHTISGVYVSTAGNAGMFVQTGAESELKNFSLKNSYITSSAGYAGCIAAHFAGKAEKIYCDATLAATGGAAYFGGLFGETRYGSAELSECWFDGTIDAGGKTWVGGLIGGAYDEAIVTHSLFSGSITAKNGAGGICGNTISAAGITFEDVLSAGVITADQWGGLVGGRQSAESTLTARNSASVGSAKWYGNSGAYVQETADNISSRPLDQLKGDGGSFLASWIDFNDHFITRVDAVPGLQCMVDGFHNNYTLDENGKRIYMISSAEDLTAFASLSQSRDFAGCTVRLSADIDLNPGWDAASETAPDTLWAQIGSASKPFAGTFEGDGHTVRGIYMNTSAQRAGMFAKTAESAVLRNFSLKNSCIITTAAYAGCVAGSFAGTAERIHVDAILHKTTSGNSRFGGLFGNIEGSSAALNECWFEGRISAAGNSYVGGMIGDLDTACDVTVSHCLFTGSITASQQVGGICGIAFASGSNITFNDTLSAGSISASQIGGLIGSRQTANSAVAAHGSVSIGSSKWYGNIGAYTSDNADNVSSRTLDDLKGEGGLFLDTWLDFEEYWIVREDAVPGLKCFTE